MQSKKPQDCPQKALSNRKYEQNNTEYFTSSCNVNHRKYMTSKSAENHQDCLALGNIVLHW